MAEANHRLTQSPTIRITTAAHCLAMLRSRNAVKDELRKHGVKASHLSARDISVWAQLFLEDHRAELIPAALAQARAMIASGALGKRAAAKFNHFDCAELRCKMTTIGYARVSTDGQTRIQPHAMQRRKRYLQRSRAAQRLIEPSLLRRWLR